MPVLRPERVSAAILEPESYDMDVHAIHQGYLRGFKRAGGELVTNAEVVTIERSGTDWAVITAAGSPLHCAGAHQCGRRLVRRHRRARRCDAHRSGAQTPQRIHLCRARRDVLRRIGR